jgi:hypothetical protein
MPIIPAFLEWLFAFVSHLLGTYDASTFQGSWNVPNRIVIGFMENILWFAEGKNQYVSIIN